MEQNDNIGIKGYVGVELYDKDGNLKSKADVNNLVTTSGHNFIARRLLVGTLGEDVGQIGIGDGANPADLTDDDLRNTLGSKKDIDFDFIDPDDSTKVQFMATFLEGESTGQVKEAGLFTDAGTLICRTVFVTPFDKAATDYLVINWKLKIG